MFEIELDPASHPEEAILRVYSGSFNVEARSISFHWDICNTVGRVIRYGDFTFEGHTLNQWLKLPIAKQKLELIWLIADHLQIKPKEV